MRKNNRLTTALLSGMLVFPAAATASDTAEQMQSGEHVFQTICHICHQIDTDSFGPSVQNMRRNTQELRHIVEQGQGMMPKYFNNLSPLEIEAVVNYIKKQQR